VKKNSKHRKNIRRKRVLKFLLLILILTLIYLFAFKTNFFHIDSIKIMGNDKMSYDEILKASTYIKGENIFNISKKKGQNSLEKLPYIKKAEVKRRLPRSIIIQIVEREEVAIIPYIGAFVYIDEEGYILSIDENKGEVELPQIFGIELIDVIPGEKLFSGDGKEAYREFIAFSKEKGLLPLMKYINFSDNNNTMIELIDGIKVAFGPLDNVKYKLSFLSKILEDMDNKEIHAKQILLNKGDNPIVVTDD